VAGDYAYLGERSNLSIIAIADKAKPSVVSSAWLGLESECRLAGKYLYTACNWRGIIVLSVAEPAKPGEVNTFDTAGRAGDLCIVGDYVYVADSDGGLFVLRIKKVVSEG